MVVRSGGRQIPEHSSSVLEKQTLLWWEKCTMPNVANPSNQQFFSQAPAPKPRRPAHHSPPPPPPPRRGRPWVWPSPPARRIRWRWRCTLPGLIAPALPKRDRRWAEDRLPSPSTSTDRPDGDTGAAGGPAAAATGERERAARLPRPLAPGPAAALGTPHTPDAPHLK